MEEPLHVFVPMTQPPASWNPIENDESMYAGTVVLQTERPMNDMEMVRMTLAGINPNLTVVNFQTFEQQVADSSTTSE